MSLTREVSINALFSLAQFWMEALVDDKAPRAGREDLQGLQELYQRIPLIIAAGEKGHSARLRFSGMCQNRLAHGSELTLMEIRRLVGNTPQRCRQEAANPSLAIQPHHSAPLRHLAEIYYDERYIVRPVRKNGKIRWKSREVFITELLRRERIGLLPESNGTFQVYFGQMYLGILEGETSTFNPNRQCLPAANQTQEQQPVSG